MNQPVYHIPALLQPTIEALAIDPDGIYVDATMGGGGHSRAILSHLSVDGHLYSFDRDSDAAARAETDPDFAGNPRFTMILGNFAYLKNYLRYNGVAPGTVNGILADLGVSFHHFDEADRGFSFRFDDAPLDMRMNRRGGATAADLLATRTEEDLARTFAVYGEFKKARQLAKKIVAHRTSSTIATTKDLVQLASPLINPRQEKKELAQIFQALRIEVNDELSALENLLRQSLDMLAPGGRLAIITYHSLEDRLVKNFMKTGNFEGRYTTDFYGRSESPMKLLTSKPVIPDDEEIERNPRSRSAKLRVAVKI